jgi:hypothetical protein
VRVLGLDTESRGGQQDRRNKDLSQSSKHLSHVFFADDSLILIRANGENAMHLQIAGDTRPL